MDYRKYMKNKKHKEQIEKWKKQKYQGELVRNKIKINDMEKMTKYKKSTIAYFNLALPMGRIMYIKRDKPNIKYCKFCTQSQIDDIKHFWRCHESLKTIINEIGTETDEIELKKIYEMYKCKTKHDKHNISRYLCNKYNKREISYVWNL